MSNNRVQRMSIAEHIKVGRALAACHDALCTVQVRNPVSARAERLSRSVDKVLTQLRSHLDDEICALTTDCDPRNIAIGVYFGADLIGEHHPTHEDAFAGLEDRRK